MTISTYPYNPDYAVPPGWVLREELEVMGLSQAEFAQQCDISAELIGDIFIGKAPIEYQTAVKFERVLGGGTEIWLNMEATYRDKLAEFCDNAELGQWARQFPVKELIKRGAVSKRSLDSERMARMMSFYNFWSLEEWEDRYGPEIVTYRNSPDFESNRQAVAVWLRLGEIQAEGTECPKYVKSKFRKSLNSIRELTVSRQSLTKLWEEAQGLCRESGVALLALEPLPGAAAGGAAWWLPPDKYMGIPAKPVILLNARHKTDDSLWHSLFHAAAHILLHGKKRVFVDAIPGGAARDQSGQCEPETQADQWAQDFLIPRAEWDKFVGAFSGGTAEVRQFAEEQGIAPGIVVGRLQLEGLLPWSSRLNSLKRKLEWTEHSA